MLCKQDLKDIIFEGYYVWKSNEETLKDSTYNFDFKDGQHFIEEIKKNFIVIICQKCQFFELLDKYKS